MVPGQGLRRSPDSKEDAGVRTSISCFVCSSAGLFEFRQGREGGLMDGGRVEQDEGIVESWWTLGNDLKTFDWT